MANLFERVATFCSTEDDGKTYDDSTLKWGKNVRVKWEGRIKG